MQALSHDGVEMVEIKMSGNSSVHMEFAFGSPQLKDLP